jgi:hypothetical protein
VNVEARTLCQPATDQDGLVRPVIVHDQVDVEAGRAVGVDSVEKLTELGRAMARVSPPRSFMYRRLCLSRRQRARLFPRHLAFLRAAHLPKGFLPRGAARGS